MLFGLRVASEVLDQYEIPVGKGALGQLALEAIAAVLELPRVLVGPVARDAAPYELLACEDSEAGRGSGVDCQYANVGYYSIAFNGCASLSRAIASES